MLTISTAALAIFGLIIVAIKYDKMTKRIEELEYDLEFKDSTLETKNYIISKLGTENLKNLNKANELQVKLDAMVISQYNELKLIDVYYNEETDEIIDSESLTKLGNL